jgi:GNAT superfamily N-acetyltransferase
MEGLTLSRRCVDERVLLRNYLHFLNQHQGHVHCFDDAWCVEGEREEYRFAIPGPRSSVAALVSRYASFLLTEQSMKFEAPLTEMGFHSVGALNFLFLSAGEKITPAVGNVRVIRVAHDAEMETFSEVQARGFYESEPAYRKWHPWLAAANQKSAGDEDQVFYLAYAGDEPAGVALAIFDTSAAGIYGVTTLPAFRKMGVSSSILRSIVHDTREREVETITVQAVHGSYAEFFCQRLGFRSAFLTRKMART